MVASYEFLVRGAGCMRLFHVAFSDYARAVAALKARYGVAPDSWRSMPRDEFARLDLRTGDVAERTNLTGW